MTDADQSDSIDSPDSSDADPSAPETYDEFAASRSDPRFTDWLRERAGDSWDDATRHRLTRELAADELADDVFRQYLVQDYAFVETLVGVFGHAVGTAPTMESKSELVSFLGVLTDDEDDYFLRAFDALDVPESVYSDPETTPATRAFIDLLERAAGQGGYAETLAVLVPAEWVYLSWATAADDTGSNPSESPSRFYLSEWIDLHAVDDFAAFVEWLRTELDREGAAASPRRQRRLEQLFRRTVELEVAFFDEAYELAPSGDLTAPTTSSASSKSGGRSSRPGDGRW
ncbi:transcriptional regulator [Haloferax sp. Atlit-6N]|uniref:Aminopyrimidine aminohydrolase n=2 Tax=Haloferax gibbonsii TaxID=35746 RepID=A0A871BM27_HALGI|nr:MULTISPECIES: TenA family protein [Haloferax]ELZ84964.1 TENA/THI-4 family protein [Haloferax gibbonsii ATCC 33959]QOS13784.1 aminopyrimidine aminohydrolase [Haloferax gibbonsii]REA02708.1 transcriptional regulator [Haloferax sp. Atlit-6N]